MTQIKERKKEIFIDADNVEDTTGLFYDEQQVQNRIESKDDQLNLYSAIGKTTILAGCQLVVTQALYTVGVTGFLPAMTALLPALGSVGVTMTNVRLDGWLPVPEDKNRIIPDAIRTSILTGQAIKLIWDAHNRESLAQQSFSQIAQQQRQALGIKPQPGISWELIGIGVIGFLFILKTLRRK